MNESSYLYLFVGFSAVAGLFKLLLFSLLEGESSKSLSMPSVLLYPMKRHLLSEVFFLGQYCYCSS